MVATGNLGDIIRQRRTELGMTQEQLAERIGFSVRQADVSRLERGKIGLPRRERLERIAEALELPLGQLLVRSGWVGADASPGETRPAPDPGDVFAELDAPVAIAAPSEPADAFMELPFRTERLHAAIAHARHLKRQSLEITERSRQLHEMIDTGRFADRSPGRD